MRLVLLFIALAAAQQSILPVPFYFSIPRTAVQVPVACNAGGYSSLWNPSSLSPAVGLRVIAIEQGAGRAARQDARRKMAVRLARDGVLQDGDVVLTFRPEMTDSMAYPHIQMGITHAGLVYTDASTSQTHVAAFNIDSPLDSLYMGQFDSAHYAGDGASDAGTDAMHIVRPRGFSAERRRQFSAWVALLKANLGRINGDRAQIKFQSDYMAPTFLSSKMSTRQTITRLGKIIIEQDKGSKQPMYCSEFAWHMLALSACTVDQIRQAGPDGAACVAPIFDPMPLVSPATGVTGLADGPLISLMAAGGSEAQLPMIFCQGGYECKNGAKLSSGHRAVATEVTPLMSGLAGLFQARLQGATAEQTAPIATQLNGAVPPNYSPTAFFVQAMTANGPMEYVATLLFVDAARARQAASQANCGASSGGVEAPRVPTAVAPVVQAAGTCIREAEKVRRAQQNLVALRHLQDGPGAADGVWGRRSQASLVSFQQKYNRAVTECLTQEAFDAVEAARQQ